MSEPGVARREWDGMLFPAPHEVALLKARADAALAEADERYGELDTASRHAIKLVKEKLAEAEAELRYMTVERDSLTEDRDDLIKDVERLKTALRLAAGELSTYGQHTTQHPQDVYDELLAGAERVGGK